MIELGVLDQDGDAPPPVPPARLDRRLIHRLVVAAVAVFTVFTATGSGPPRPPFVRVLWQVPFSDGDAMSLDATTVYANRQQAGQRTLSAFDLATGRMRWSAPAGAGGFPQAPAVGGVLLTQGGLADFRFPLPNGNFEIQSYVTSTVARDAGTGRTLWTTAGDALDTSGESALLGERDARGRLARLKVVGLRDGVTRWTRPVRRVAAWTVAEAGDRPAQVVLAEPDGRLTMLDYASGSTVRTGQVSLPGPAPHDESSFASIGVVGNALIVSRVNASANDSRVYRFDTLEALWETDRSVTDCGVVFCTMDEAGLSGHDPVSGAVRWHRPGLGGYFTSAGDRILASGSSSLGPWRVIDAATGRDVGAPVQGQPTWVGEDLHNPALLVGTVPENYRLNSVIQMDLVTGESYLLGTIGQAPAFDCQSTPGYLVCAGPGRLEVTAVG